MGEHIDLRTQSRKKKKIKEHDTSARQARVSFKRYLRELEEELEEDLLDLDDGFDDNDLDESK